MAKIAVLDQSIAELIAAGEVIERPASIVKEVLENSIDAGASRIVVEIKNGGRTYIRVTDDGCGIAKEDMPTAFLRHATSKIREQDDLTNIATLGFRGEALASICAVAEVEMTSKVKEEDFGNVLRLKAGEQVAFEQTGCPDGTTIIIRNLFYNVPVRQKFLKKDGSETAAVTSVVEKIMLSHPEISFRYITDGTVKISGGGAGELMDTVYAVFGREFAGNMLTLDYAFGGIRVRGCITRPDAGRATRGMQHFYVNNRFVKSKTCAAALEDGYHGSIMVGKFPACVLDVDMEYSMVDVNVHPAKIEIRFSDEKAVYDAVYFAVKNKLLEYDALQNQLNRSVSLAPAVHAVTGEQVEFREEMPVLSQNNRVKEASANKYRNVFGSDDADNLPSAKDLPSAEEIPEFTESDAPPVKDEEEEFVFPFLRPAGSEKKVSEEKTVPKKQNAFDLFADEFADDSDAASGNDFVKMPAEDTADKRAEEAVTEAADSFEDDMLWIPQTDANGLESQQIRYIGELFSTYVLMECGENMILMDKHAAHERLLYERLKEQTKLGESQMLLVPASAVVSSSEYEMLFASREQLEKFGFAFDDFGCNTVLIRAVPPILSEQDVFAMLLEAAQKIFENRHDENPGFIDDLLHDMACKAAIKAHDDSTKAELIHLARIVLENDEIRHCPHGRPVLQMMSKRELDKKFGRIV